MKVRSPLLGYNHNIRYGGRLYHVQTEDSGVNNPHVFTHLFFGGTILASKRIVYDPGDTDLAVQQLMKAQHKGMLHELRDGFFDVKIAQFFGEAISAAGSHSDALPPERLGELPTDGSGEAPAGVARDTPDGTGVGSASDPSAASEADPGGEGDLTATLVAPLPSPALSLALALALADDDEATDINAPGALPSSAPVQVLAAELTLPPDLVPATKYPSRDTIPVPRLDFAELTRPSQVAPVPSPAPPPVPAPTGHRSTQAFASVVAPRLPVPAEGPRPIPTSPAPAASPPRSAFDLPPPRRDFPSLSFTPPRVPAVPRTSPSAMVNRPVVVAGLHGAGRPGPQTQSALPAPSPPRPTHSAPPSTASDNIFGDPFSDKSLDEVILAYLSEDPPEQEGDP